MDAEREAAGQGSSGRVIIEIREDDEREVPFSLSSNEWLNSTLGNSSSMPKKAKIQMVQPLLREVETNEKCYDPRVVSIGPCHHGKPELQVCESLKLQMAREYVRNSNATIDQVYSEVFKVAGDARESYSEGLTERFDHEAFTKMMFLDGCFILQYIQDHNSRMIERRPLVLRDLFLLENQIPFLVLHVLMRFSCANGKGKKMITDFIKGLNSVPSPRDPFKKQIKNLVRKSSWGSQRHHEDQEDESPIHLLELLRRKFINPNAFSPGCYISSGWYHHHTANDFKMAGIRFRPSKTCQFTDIQFKSTCTSAILSLPQISIDDTTKSTLLNLAAYEACPDHATDFGVSSYICFMDSLIDHPEDVKELGSKGILLNFLGSDQQVADLFYEMATDLVPSPHAYVQVKSGIEKHLNSRWKGWNLFTISAAVLVINLTLIQTVLTAIQTYFAVYPPKRN